MASRNQYYPGIADLIEKAEQEYKDGAEVHSKRLIPSPDKIPQRNGRWLKIEGVISVFVDMKGSTKLSATKHGKSTAEICQFFTDTMVRILRKFGAAYIDVKGDGIFGVFNPGMHHTALCAAVTCKTFTSEEFNKRVRAKIKMDLGCHIGIDQKTVLVKRVGIEPRGGDDSHLRNEVWAGKPVNMSAKLASHAGDGSILVSHRFYNKLTNRHSKESCGCNNGGEVSGLWEEVDVAELDYFDFDRAHRLDSNWCATHGREYCEEMVNQEKDRIKESIEESGVDSFLLT